MKKKYKILTLIILVIFCGQLFAAEENATSMRDPMIPPDMSIFEASPAKLPIKRSPFKIQGIGRSDKDAYVIIGGKVYREGDTKGEITVVKITGTAVDILVNGVPETLLVKEK